MTRMTPGGLVAIASVSFCVIVVYASLMSVLHSQRAYAGVPAELSEENVNVVRYIAPFSNGDLSFLSEDERSHMADVKRLFDVFFALALLSLGALAGILWKLERRCWEELLERGLRLAGWLLLGLCLVVVLGALLDFQKLFVLFHLMLFPQGNWMFPADSMLLQLYPSVFFRDFALSWMLLTALAGVAAVLLSAFTQRMRLHERVFKGKVLKQRRRRVRR